MVILYSNHYFLPVVREFFECIWTLYYEYLGVQ